MKGDAKQGTESPPQGGGMVKLQLVDSEQSPSVFSNHAIIQRTATEFFISFFEIRPPLFLCDPVERQKAVDNDLVVRSACVARLVMTPEIAKSLLEALARNLEEDDRAGN